MSAHHFIRSQVLKNAALVEIDDVAVVERYGWIKDAIEQRCGRDAATLLAEPRLTRGNGVADSRIDWYAAVEGIAKTMSELDPGSLAAVNARLAERLGALSLLSSDPTLGPLVSAALNLPTSDALLSVGGEPVIIYWGTLPLGAMQDREAREALFARGLKPYLPSAPLPPVSRAEWQRAHPESVAAAAAAAPVAAATAASSDASARGAGLVAPIVSCVLAALAAIALMIPGVLRYPDHRPVSAANLEVVRALIVSLKARADELKVLLAKDCDEIRAGLDGPDRAAPPTTSPAPLRDAAPKAPSPGPSPTPAPTAAPKSSAPDAGPKATPPTPLASPKATQPQPSEQPASPPETRAAPASPRP